MTDWRSGGPLCLLILQVRPALQAVTPVAPFGLRLVRLEGGMRKTVG